MVPQDLRDEQAESTGAHDGRPRVLVDSHLLDDPTRCSCRFDEHGRHIVECVRYGVQISRWKRQVFGEGPVATDDSQDRADLTMSAPSRATPSTVPAADCNFADDTFATPTRIGCGRLRHDADEFVPRHTGKSCIAAQQLEIGAANARGVHFDQALVGGTGCRSLLQGQTSLGVEHKCAHEPD
jgi:hypothetical protein